MITAFATSYAAARDGFRMAAAEAGAQVTGVDHDLRGPAGEPLATDIAWLGPADAVRVLVLLSGVHGIEGFCGSGCQTAWLASGEADRLPPDTAVMLVHAVNPHGFACARRVNEDNIDLNRNGVDFSRPLPVNAGYDELRDAICPPTWFGPVRAAAEARLAAYAEVHGAGALQAAISGGQWSDPLGVFYGGDAPSWSRRTLADILVNRLQAARRVAIVDLHTGLGAFGACEIIVPSAPGTAAFQRARDWFGLSVTSPGGGASTSAPVIGDLLSFALAQLPWCDVTIAALEFGVGPTDRMIEAVRADAWLHTHDTLDSAPGREIKARMRAAFIGDTPAWEGMVFGQMLLSCRQAIVGLNLDYEPR